LLKEYAWRGEEVFFGLFEHTYKYLFLKNLVDRIKSWEFLVTDYTVPDIGGTKIVFRHPGSNVVVEIDLRKPHIQFKTPDGTTLSLQYNNSEKFEKALELLELESKYRFLGDIEKAALELEDKLKELAETARVGEELEYTFTSSSGVVVEVKTGDVHALKEHIRKFTAPLILLGMYARSVLSEPSEVYEEVKSKLLDKISSRVSWFFSAIDWDSTGWEVAKAAEELAEYVPEFPSSVDDVYGALLAAEIERKLLDGLFNQEDMEAILNGYYPVRVAGSPDLLTVFSDFTKNVEFKGVVESPVVDRPAVHPTALISSLLTGYPANFTGTKEMEYEVSLIKTNSGLEFGLWSTQEGGVAVPSIFVVTKNNLYLDVAGLIALGLLEERYGFVSKLAEKLEKDSEELLEKASKYARLVKVFHTAYFKEAEESPPTV
jgi:nucleotide-binding universal stress UspA family protein